MGVLATDGWGVGGIRWRQFLPSPIFISALIAAVFIMLVGERTMETDSQEAIPQLPIAAVQIQSAAGAPEVETQPDRPLPDLERPLFSPTRRPVRFDEVRVEPEPEPAFEAAPELAIEPEVVQPDPPQIMLLGAMQSGGDWYALIRRESNDDERWYRRGETIEGWEIGSITANEVELVLGETTVIAKLYN